MANGTGEDNADGLEPLDHLQMPTKKYLVLRVILECFAIIALAYPMLHIYVILQGNIEPYKRGFFCDDESIKYPLLENTIPIGTCFLIWFFIVIILIPLVEIFHITLFVKNPPSVGRIPWIFIELYRIFGYFSLGALCTLLTTELAKYKIGRLRPHFLAACSPNFDQITCRDTSTGMPLYVTKFECSKSPAEEKYARKSFMSGHASFSFYCATFLIVYMHARFTRTSYMELKLYNNNRTKKAASALVVLFVAVKILKPFLQFGFFALAFYICITRISDYHHHPGDVFMGSLVGIGFATITLVILMNLFNRPRTFKLTSPESEPLNELGLALDSYVNRPSNPQRTLR